MVDLEDRNASEYLMTYGWALLVIIIVGAALFALGVLNPATYNENVVCSELFNSTDLLLFEEVDFGNANVISFKYPDNSSKVIYATKFAQVFCEESDRVFQINEYKCGYFRQNSYYHSYYICKWDIDGGE